MRRLPFALLALAVAPSLAACRDKAKPQAKAGSGTAPAPAAVDAAPAAPGKPMVPVAVAPEAATAELCQVATTHFAPGFQAVASALEVPADKVDGVANELAASFAKQCASDGWPVNLLPCLTRQIADIFTYRRCFERLPTAKRDAWSAYVYQAVAKAGGKAVEVTSVSETPPDGVPFEQVCPSFVAEVARFDACAGGAMYLPEAEEVYGERRRVEVGGVVPAAEIEHLKQVCAARAELTRKATTSFCKKLRPDGTVQY